MRMTAAVNGSVPVWSIDRAKAKAMFVRAPNARAVPRAVSGEALSICALSRSAKLMARLASGQRGENKASGLLIVHQHLSFQIVVEQRRGCPD